MSKATKDLEKYIDTIKKERNAMEKAHLAIIHEISHSNKERINILNDVRDISKRAVGK